MSRRSMPCRAPHLLALLVAGSGAWGCGPTGEVRPRCGEPSCADTGPDTDTDTDPVDPPPVAAVTVASTGPIVCADPSAREEARFDQRDSALEPPKKLWFWGGGVAVGDLDGDGLRDIVLPGRWTTVIYAGAAGGDFVLDTETLGDLDLSLASGASVADYDGDEDLDLLVTRFQARDVLLRNDGGTFVDVTDEAGIADIEARSMASSWADYDGDGDLDLFVGSYGFIDETQGGDHSGFEPAEPSFLYVNDGDGTFTDRSAELPREVHDGYTFTGGFHDLDGDMRPELYVVNDFGVAYPNVLMWNRGGGVLELDGNAAGLDIAITGMGLGLGDLNGDLIPDMLQPAWNDIYLHESSALGVWYEWAVVKGITYDSERAQKIGWGTELIDIDNDGDLDAPVVFGYLDSTYNASLKQPDALYIQQEDGSFVDEGPDWGIHHPGVGRGFVATDLNDDGWLDLVMRDLDGPTRMYLSRCGEAAWLRMRLHAPGLNRHAIGARVRVVAGERDMVRWVHAGGTNHASGGPPEVHVGLGDLERIDRVEITWPDGAVSVLEDVAARHIIDVHRDPDTAPER